MCGVIVGGGTFYEYKWGRKKTRQRDRWNVCFFTFPFSIGREQRNQGRKGGRGGRWRGGVLMVLIWFY